jgi:hypothetical protein
MLGSELAVSTTSSYLTCSDPVTVHIPTAQISALTTKPTEKLAVMQNDAILSCGTPSNVLALWCVFDVLWSKQLIACNLDKVYQ